MNRLGAGVLLAAVAGVWTMPGRAAAQTGKLVVVKMVEVSPREYQFQPAQVAVAAGDTVRFVQTGAMPHNVEFRSLPAGVNLGETASGPYLLKKGETYDVVITPRFLPGTYGYVCAPHVALGMKGSITVAQAR